MPKKNSNVGRRAWNAVRLALLWARKGGAFRGHQYFRVVVPKFIMKSIGSRGGGGGDRIQYITEHQLSFDKTPVVHIKMNRPNSMRFLIPNIPCINPPLVDFDGEEPYSARKSFLIGGVDDDDDDDDEESYGEEEIDSRAEEFIARFYEQMKMQRQISYLEYTSADHASIKRSGSN